MLDVQPPSTTLDVPSPSPAGEHETTGGPVVVGVVVPARDAARWLRKTLVSLQEQTHRSWFCVVVDDCSTDDTRTVAEAHSAEDPRFHVVTGPGRGVAAARNAGLRVLPEQCQLVHFLDSDDLLQPEALTSLLSALSVRPDAVTAWALADYVDDQDEQVSPGVHPQRQLDRRAVRGWRLVPLPAAVDSTYADLVVYNPVWPAAVALHRRAAVEAIGGFREDLLQLEDWDLCLRLSRMGPLVPVPAVLVLYRRHAGNLTRAALQNDGARDVLLLGAYADTWNSPVHRRTLVRGARRRRLADAVAALRTTGGALKSLQPQKAVRAAVAAVWITVSLPQSRPPSPDLRRTAWARALDAHSTWDV